MAMAWMLLVGCASRETTILVAPKSSIMVKLLDIDGNRVESTFECPKGTCFSLVVGFNSTAEDSIESLDGWGSLSACPLFDATLSVFQDRKKIHKYRLSSASSEPCNWLSREGLDGAFWTIEDLFSQCKPGQKYSIVLDCIQRPPRIKSLWLSYWPTPMEVKLSPKEARIMGEILQGKPKSQQPDDTADDKPRQLHPIANCESLSLAAAEEIQRRSDPYSSIIQRQQTKQAYYFKVQPGHTMGAPIYIDRVDKETKNLRRFLPEKAEKLIQEESDQKQAQQPGCPASSKPPTVHP